MVYELCVSPGNENDRLFHRKNYVEREKITFECVCKVLYCTFTFDVAHTRW